MHAADLVKFVNQVATGISFTVVCSLNSRLLVWHRDKVGEKVSLPVVFPQSLGLGQSLCESESKREPDIIPVGQSNHNDEKANYCPLVKQCNWCIHAVVGVGCQDGIPPR